MSRSVKTPKRPAGLRAAAAYADVHVTTIRRRIADGTLTGYRSGPRLLLVDLDEIDRKLIRPVPAVH